MKMSDPGTDLQIKAIVSVMGMAPIRGCGHLCFSGAVTAGVLPRSCPVGLQHFRLPHSYTGYAQTYPSLSVVHGFHESLLTVVDILI